MMKLSNHCLAYAVLAASAFSRIWCYQIGRYSKMNQAQRHQNICLDVFSNDEADNYMEDDFDELSDEELEATVGRWDEKIARFNSIQLTGRVGNTPEARYFDDGKVVVNLSLATQRKYHVMDRKLNNIKAGEEETDWYGLEVWVS
jgi:Single-strand binding protein family